MGTNKKRTEAETLEQYRIALENVEKQKEIAKVMSRFGYDKPVIVAGKKLFEETRKIYDANIREDDETSEAYSKFTLFREELARRHKLHRKIAKVVFKKEPTQWNKLHLTGEIPKAYVKWLETVKKFYSEIVTDNSLQVKLARLKLTDIEINSAVKLITTVEVKRALFIREKGESQEATKAKDKAFSQIDDWFNDFYTVAKIALEDSPQLLESIGKLVRS